MGHSGSMVSTVSTPSKRTALYRHFDASGRLLYIGISLNAVSRLAQHRITSPWFEDIARIELEWHETRTAAHDAERAAIRDERPIHNGLRYGMPDELYRMIQGLGKLHMVDADGRLLDEYASLGPGEAEAIADRWDATESPPPA